MLNDNQIKSYTKMVENNHYSELLLQVASDFKLGYFEEIFKSILNLHHTLGNMDMDLSKFRYTMKKEMMDQIKEILSESEFKVLKSLV